jgi:ParB-like chromosome segregation protein Spo0J
MTETRRISDIVIGPRFRKVLRNIDELADNIKEISLLLPISIKPNGQLIDGCRRIEAFKLLGRAEIPVHVVDIERIVQGEFAANTYRDDFLPSEDLLQYLELVPPNKKLPRETNQVAQGALEAEK